MAPWSSSIATLQRAGRPPAESHAASPWEQGPAIATDVPLPVIKVAADLPYAALASITRTFIRAGDEFAVARSAARSLTDTRTSRQLREALECMTGNSFTPDTRVATAAGAIAIAEIRVGDDVLAYNEATGEVGSYPVTATHEHEDPVLIDLTVDPDPMDDQPGEVIVTTPEHPFWVLGEWVDAEDLTVGMPLSRPTEDGGLSASGTVWETDPLPTASAS